MATWLNVGGWVSGLCPALCQPWWAWDEMAAAKKVGLTELGGGRGKEGRKGGTVATVRHAAHPLGAPQTKATLLFCNRKILKSIASLIDKGDTVHGLNTTRALSYFLSLLFLWSCYEIQPSGLPLATLCLWSKGFLSNLCLDSQRSCVCLFIFYFWRVWCWGKNNTSCNISEGMPSYNLLWELSPLWVWVGEVIKHRSLHDDKQQGKSMSLFKRLQQSGLKVERLLLTWGLGSGTYIFLFKPGFKILQLNSCQDS